MIESQTTATAGWSCWTLEGKTQWSAWNERGGMQGVASTFEDGRAKAAAASEILNLPGRP